MLSCVSRSSTSLFREAPENVEYAIKCYQAEVSHLVFPRRLSIVLNSYNSIPSDSTGRASTERNKTVAGTEASSGGNIKNLSESQGPWIVGDGYTIADLACISWFHWAEWADVELDDFP